ncbi:MAG: hypothetical protein MUC83_19360 [Pirellula sp.]|nr:hypothetical protein [Pirellula sp.]
MLFRTQVGLIASALNVSFVLNLLTFAPTSHAEDSVRGMKLVFSDDFENGRSKWEMTDDSSWDIVKSADNHTLSINKRVSNYTPKHRSPHNIAWLKDLPLKSFAIKLKVRSTKDTGNHRDCCIFFSKQNADQFYYVHLGAKPDPASGQVMIVNNAPRSPLTKNETPVAWDDKWHEVLLIRDAESGLIEVFFDNMTEPIMQCKDSTFLHGAIGIGSFDDMNEFDDIRVYTADSPSNQ